MESPVECTEIRESPFIKRVGRFQITGVLLRAPEAKELWRVIYPLEMRWRYDYPQAVCEVSAYSELFEETEDFTVPPDYEIIVERKPGPQFVFSAKRK